MRVVASADAFFLDRYDALVKALETHAGAMTRVPGGNLAEWLPLRLYNAATRGTRLHGRLLDPDPNPRSFIVRSRLAARKIEKLPQRPDLIFHIFCTYVPSGQGSP